MKDPEHVRRMATEMIEATLRLCSALVSLKKIGFDKGTILELTGKSWDEMEKRVEDSVGEILRGVEPPR